MELVIPNGFALATYHHTSIRYDGEAIFSFGIDLNAVVPDAALAEDLYDVWAAVFNPNWPNEVTFSKFRLLYRMADVLQAEEHVENTTGSVPDELAPPNCAILVSKKTSLVGRRFRGRAYLPGMGINAIFDSSTWAPTMVGIAQAGVDALLADYDTRGMTGVILHSDATPPTPISAALVRSRIATQRGRLRN